MPARKKSTKKSKSSASNLKIIQEPLATKKENKLKEKKVFFILIPLILGLLILGYAFSKWAVLAWVDGQPITRFEYFQKLEESGAGEQLKEQMIVEKLVYSEADKKGVSASQDEINKEYKSVESQIGTESMKLQLSQVNMTEEDFKNQLQTRILIRKLFGTNTTVSEDELSKYIEDQSALFDETGNIPELTEEEKVKLKEELLLQKIQENFSKWVNEAKTSSRVVKN